MLLIISESILKGIASECICGKYATKHIGKDAEIWQILIKKVNKDQLYVWMSSEVNFYLGHPVLKV